MDFGFRESQAAYDSGSQSARVWTEEWAAEWLYCPNCGNARLTRFPANLPVADFYCSQCEDQFELKSKKTPFGPKLANGAYSKKIERLSSATNPNFFLLTYDLPKRAVTSVKVIPKHYFSPEIVEQRRPLAPTAKRAGWVGSNILLSRIPEAGIIDIVRGGIVRPKDDVLNQWRQTRFLREFSPDARGWLVEVMKSIEAIGSTEFDISDIYAFERRLGTIFPNNNNVRPKIRQQLQFLRNKGYLDFIERGKYRLRGSISA